MEACVQVAGLLGAHGKRGGQCERHDRAHNHRQLGTHKHGDNQSRAGKGHAREQRDTCRAVQALAHARNVTLIIGNTARDQHDKQRHHHKKWRELHQLNSR